MRSLRAALTVGLACALVGPGCYKDEPLTALEHGLTRILLTDAPWPYDSVARVDLHIVEIMATSEPDTTFLGQWWTTVTSPNRSFNLLDLQQGTTALVGQGQLPAGEYRAIRMVIDTDLTRIWAKVDVDASGNPIAGRSPMPVDWQSSAGRPALYAFVEGNTEVGAEGADIVIDFDVGRSFIPRPDGGFTFSPVLRAVNEASTGAITGAVSGDTLAEQGSVIPDVTITVYSGSPAADENTWSVRATGKTDANGEFTIRFLLPGTYIIRSDAPRSSPYSPGVRSGVTVERGVTTGNVDIRLPQRTAESFEVLPAQMNIAVGETDTVYAIATDNLGRVIVGAAVTWSWTDSQVVRVTPAPNQSSMAFVEALRSGGSQVSARWGTYTDYASVVASDTGFSGGGGAVASVELYPRNVNALVGDSVGFHPTVRNSNGDILYDRAVTWSVSDSTVLRPYCCGVYRAMKQGTATVTATSEGVSGNASVIVLP